MLRCLSSEQNLSAAKKLFMLGAFSREVSCFQLLRVCLVQVTSIGGEIFSTFHERPRSIVEPAEIKANEDSLRRYARANDPNNHSQSASTGYDDGDSAAG